MAYVSPYLYVFNVCCNSRTVSSKSSLLSYESIAFGGVYPGIYLPFAGAFLREYMYVGHSLFLRRLPGVLFCALRHAQLV